jgi:predicted RNA-binding protein YlxR (DUF448 family)
MKLRETKPQRLLRFIDSIEPEVATKPRHKKTRRAAYAAAGVAVLTAASAGISSLRDRLETSSDSS